MYTTVMCSYWLSLVTYNEGLLSRVHIGCHVLYILPLCVLIGSHLGFLIVSGHVVKVLDMVDGLVR